MIDILLLILFAYAVIKGIIKGFVIEAASLIGVLLGIYCARIYTPMATGKMCEWINCSNIYATPITYLIIFFAIVFLCHFCAKILDKTLNIFLLGWLNKLLGGLFGFLKYLFIASILLNFFNKIDEHTHFLSNETKESSFLYYPVKSVVPSILPFIQEKNFGDF